MSKVSIVVPCFNQEAFIAEALESVLRQSYSDWECIIVNDGSTDGSEAIIERYAKKERRFLSLAKENGGVAAARNFGFARASGALFVPLDGDDKLHPDFLQTRRRVLHRASGYRSCPHEDTALWRKPQGVAFA
jgi:Glycosyltransferases involved in cell wall biogenesis